MPCTSVIAVAPIASTVPIIARLRTPLGDSSEVASTTVPASARNTTCLKMNMSRVAPMRAATAGEAASIST